MTANYFTLKALVEELRPKLEGSRFLEAYSVRSNEIRLKFDRLTLVALLRPITGALFTSSQEERTPKQNIHHFFESLSGEGLRSITLAPYDRLVSLDFGSSQIAISFFAAPNAVLIRDGEVVESFKRQIEKSLEVRSDGKIEDLLGKRYLREAKEQGIPPNEFVEQLQSSRSAIVYSKGDEVLLSLIDLKSLSGWQSEHQDSVDAAVRKVVIARGRLSRVSGLRKRLLDSVDAEIERLSRSRSEMRKGIENSNRAERYAAIGNALLQAAHEIASGVSEVSLEIEEQSMTVKLDPTITPYENASRYFDRSKSARESKQSLRDRSQRLDEDNLKLESRRTRIIEAKDLRELEQIEREQGKRAAKGQEQASGFREFTVAGGMKVLVGKNAKQNDELTTRVAKKDDVWLHARGVPGSHVVLQVAGRKQVPKESIEQAAEIAAYFSGARTQGLAPVSYALRKYVRKPKGADPGAVIMEREEVIMVVPREGRTKN